MKTKKAINYIITTIIILSLLISNCFVKVYASTNTEPYDIANLNDNTVFSDNEVIVIFDQNYSFEFNEYDYEVLDKVDCINSRELTASFSHLAQTTKNSIQNAVLNNTEIAINNSLDFSYYHKILCLELVTPGKENVIDAIRTINDIDGVLCALPNFEISIDVSNVATDITHTPNEIYDLIGLNDAWDYISNIDLSTVRVAVLDSGIDTEHSSLSGKIDTSTSAYFLDYFGDGQNYSEDGILGEHVDDYGHGTHVAGIIGGAFDSPTGFRGVCPSVEFVSIKILNGQGKGALRDLISAMNYVRSLGGTDDSIPIINISAGTADFFYEFDNQVNLQNAIFGYNGLVVCSAGNNNADLDTVSRFPAGLDGNNLITVGASTYDDTRWIVNNESGSNYGGTTVDLFAPGVDIVSCIPTGICPSWCSNPTLDPIGDHYSSGFHSCTGTSMAAPFVTGVAALMKSINPEISATWIKSIITANVDYSTNQNDNLNQLFYACDSTGRINAYNSIINACDHSNATYWFIANNYTYHNASCNICGEVFLDPHDWVLNGSTYRCVLCGRTTTNRPPTIITGLLSNPEKITVNFLPSNDEDDLTE